MARRVKEENRPDLRIEWYDTEKYAEWNADYVDSRGVKPFTRAPELDEELDGKKIFAVKIPRLKKRETDSEFIERILEVMPENHTYTAEDLGNARGDEIDYIGAQYGLTRRYK